MARRASSRRLAAERPFETDGDLLAAAARLARELPADEAVELVNAHPRIGAEPASVSALSHEEQGYAEDDPSGDAEAARVAEELEWLNDAYERVHGFRYAVFVAGRPRGGDHPAHRGRPAQRDRCGAAARSG